MPAAVWLPPSDHHVDGWRVTKLWQLADRRQVCVGAVILSTEPGAGTVGVPLTEQVVKALLPILEEPAPDDPDTRLRQVAAVYTAALEAGEPPVKAVAAAFGVADGTAGNMVWRARQREFLPKTTPGKTAA